MGWQHEKGPGHEGWIVGLVVREGCDPDSRLFRELAYPTDAGDRTDIVRLAAGCECGWRSPHFDPREPASWMPHCVIASERDEDRARELWVDHVCDPLRIAASRAAVSHIFGRVLESRDLAYQIGHMTRSRELLVEAALLLFPRETREQVERKLAEADRRHFARAGGHLR